MAEPRQHGFTTSRVLDASRERVWKEWTEPERFADWFGGAGADVPLSTVSMDVRPGGAWKATMYAGPDRTEIRWSGEYHEVVEPQRLVFTISDRAHLGLYELLTVDLTDLGDGRTEMVVEQRGHMRPEDYDRAKSGWGAFFDRMVERLGHNR